MTENNKPLLIHWSDITADRIIRQKGDKDEYVLASGITPSGVVHFGNFRETITVDLVARALRKRGKKVRFIFSWDDYDTFRKIPKNLPKQDELEKYLFTPIVDTPDPFEQAESYAAHHEKNYENQLEKVGIEVEAIYQAKKYKNGDYKEQIKLTIENRDKIKSILDEHRTSPLPSDWMPVSIYCGECNRDKISNITYDNEIISYSCDSCGHQGQENLGTTGRVKLPWRMDWPMRWVYEGVDFEPGGKDHSSQGGSYSTGKELVAQVYGGTAPIYLQYDFVSIKGGSGKMSSSSGEVVTVNDVLKVYEPEMVRWIFASYKTNIDFAVSFDLDVIKTYEDFDRQERIAFEVEKANEKKTNMAKRVYELSQIKEVPNEMPLQPSFRHLCNILQINEGNLEKTRESYKDQIKNERDERRFVERSNCALFWLKNYAPEEFKFSVNKTPPSIKFDKNTKDFLTKVSTFLSENGDNLESDKELHEKLYEFIHELEDFTPADAFKALYQLLINQEKGPKLAGFIRTIGTKSVSDLINTAVK